MQRANQMPDLVSDVVEWVKGERAPISRLAFLLEITQMARINRLWPEASYEQWEEAIEQAITSGKVVENNGKLSLATEPAAQKQLELF